MEYNISEAELPTMVVRYENKLILRSVITGQHLEDLGYAPIWDDVPMTPALQARRQRIERAHNEALEALVNLYPCEELVPPQMMQTTQPSMPQIITRQSPPKKLLPLIPMRPPTPLSINEAELPPCKVHRNYCCNYCNFCTQNPRSHLLHQRQVHGIRLSIHCCHHCQYASRYFQKLKRHVKMVHMGSSPGRSKMRNKIAARRAPKPKVVKATSVVQQQQQPPKTPQAELPSSEPVQPNQTQVPQLPIQPVQKSELITQNAAPAAGSTLTSAIPPAVFKNPEAFFEAAYRNQIIQQQMQEQRFKEFVKLSNQLNKVNQPESTKLPTEVPVTTPPTKDLQQKNQAAIENVKEIKTTSTPKPSAIAILSHSLVSASATTEHDKKRVYGCRKCSYVTHIKSRYNKHVKYHSMPMIQCDKCEFRTTYKWNLTRHLRSHHGNGLYKCSVCSFSAHMKQSLTSHELNHHSPPVGHVTRVHNKPFRRRRCRVGGSDLMHEMRAVMNGGGQTKSEPITADNQENLQNQSGTVGHESLKLVIKREAGTSSYSSSQTNQLVNWKTDQTGGTATMPLEINDDGSKHSSSPPASFTSSYTASPCSSCSNLGITENEISTKCLETNDFKAENANLSPQHEASITQTEASEKTEESEESGILQISDTSSQMPESLNAQSELLQATNVETKTPDFCQPPIINTELPPIRAAVIYTSSEDSDPDSDEDSDDSCSTVSANETVPHGLHIAYESSSPDRISNLSDSESTSECSSKLKNTHEIEVNSNTGFQANVSTS